MGFPKQESWSGLLFPSPGHLPHPGAEPGSPALQVGSLPTERRGGRQRKSVPGEGAASAEASGEERQRGPRGKEIILSGRIHPAPPHKGQESPHQPQPQEPWPWVFSQAQQQLRVSAHDQAGASSLRAKVICAGREGFPQGSAPWGPFAGCFQKQPKCCSVPPRGLCPLRTSAWVGEAGCVPRLGAVSVNLAPRPNPGQSVCVDKVLLETASPFH